MEDSNKENLSKIIPLHKLGFESSVFWSILEGKKTIEGRLAKGKFLSFTVGDKILLREDIWEDGKIVNSRNTGKVASILAVKQYVSFEEMLKSEGLENVLPSAQSLQDALKIYRQFYSKNDEDKYGVVALKIALG